MGDDDKNLESFETNLWEVEIKLRGLGYLIYQLGSDPAPPLPDEMEAIHNGIGLLLIALAEDLRQLRETS
ncbi:MAG: hypothetical protein KDD50_05095 [Bdellovibrionales bacterium]|nr:hypothetical protein [Bdellovibrionales bacterium]